jgi:WD40 repeat protein
VSTGALLCVYTGHSRAVTCLQIFSESDSPQLNLQKLSSTDSYHYSSSTSSSSSSSSSSNSKRALLATGSCDGSVRVFDVDTGDCLDTLRSVLTDQPCQTTLT